MKRKIKQKITTFLWFNHSQAEKAAKFYMSIFPRSKIVEIMRYGEAGPGPKGGVMAVTFELEGQEFMALNGDSPFQFTPAISLFVKCDTQKEVDTLWKKLSTGGKTIQCGWLTDKFGVTWQIVPAILLQYLQDPDPVKSARVMRVMMNMVKLDIAPLKRAYQGSVV